jgi:hypothetical protein
MLLIKAIRMGITFLKLLERAQYYQIQTSKVKCVFKNRYESIYFDLNRNILLEDNWVSIGKKVTIWR